MASVRRLLLLCSLLVGDAAATERAQHPLIGSRTRLLQSEQVVLAAPQEQAYSLQTFTQPISHFPKSRKYAPHVNGTFEQRYWVDTSSYKPGGPVILLDAGETGGEGRIPFLTQGIVKILANATNGVGVVLEMRMYGKSFVTPDLSTDNLRFLDTKQSLADAANFAQNVKFPGLEDQNLTASKAPWIYYGGSYAGAKAAYAKVVYPDVFFGAIASSGVTKAITNYYQYYDPIIRYADPTCIANLESAVQVLDKVLRSRSSQAIDQLKTAFGLENLVHNEDIGPSLVWAISWQGRNWNPEVSDPSWDNFCAALASPSPPLFGSRPLGAYASATVLWVEDACGGRENVESCLGTFGADAYSDISLGATYRLWGWQFCTEEGYYQPAPPRGLPTIVSRTFTVAYQQRICNLMFPPVNYTSLPPSPRTDIPNAYGGFSIAADRLAFIDGQADPWVAATPHAPTLPERPDTLLRPFYLIPGGVHHWDENSLPGGLANESLPPEIRKVQAYEVEFVQSWLKDFKPAA